MWFNVASCLVEHTLCFYPSFFTQMISDRTTWRRYVRFTCWWELVVCWVGPFLTLIFVFAPSDEDMDNCMLFFHQPFLIFVDPWLTSWGSLEMQTQAPPWLSLSSSGMVESYSSLFVIDTRAVLMIKEGTSLEFAWKLHLQWLRGVFCVHGRSQPYETP